MSDLFDWQGPYPVNPGTKERRINGASSRAAEKVKPHAPRLRGLVFECIKARGPLTADETALHLGLDVLTVRPRCSELVKLGLLVPTLARRPSSRGTSSTVWALAPGGAP